VDFAFEVGVNEKHSVVYSWDQVWGGLSMTVDGIRVLKKRQILGFSLVTAEEITVGDVEKHVVRVEKRRELLLAGFRPQILTAFVDGQQVAQAESTIPPEQKKKLITWTIVYGVIGGIVAVTIAAVATFSAVRALLGQ